MDRQRRPTSSHSMHELDMSAGQPGPLVPEHAFAASTVETRRTALRLRTLDTHSLADLPTRSALVWTLPAADPTFTRRIALGYLFRRERPLEVALTVTTSWPATRFDQPATPMTRRELQTLAGVALPGFAPVAPELPALTGAAERLAPPCIDVLAAAQTVTPPTAKPASRPAAHAVLLGRHDTVIPDIDPCIVALAEADRDLDLVFEMSTGPLPAATLRALRTCEERLHAAWHRGGAHAPARLAWCFERLQRWRTDTAPARNVMPWLRFPDRPDPGVMRIATTMLFGPDAGEAHPSAGHIDLSTAAMPAAPPPGILPDPRTLETVRRVAATRYRRPPRRSGLVLGRDTVGRKQVVAAEDLRQHCYVIGATGTGKSSLLRSMIRQDIAAGVPVFLCDPHGDLYADVLADMPPDQRRRAIIADASDFETPFTLNILDVRGPNPAIQRNYIANQLIALFKTLYGANREAFGPMFESYFRAALLLLMEGGGSSANLADMERVFGDAAYRRTLLEHCRDPQVRSFWHNIALRAQGESSLSTIAPYITSKLVQLSGNALIRPILCSPRTSLDLPAALAEGRSVLVNLSKGLVGGPDAGILGGIITIRLIAAAMTRTREERQQRRLMRVYLDEFPSFGAHGLLAEAMAEIRKFGLSLVLANQSIAQIDGRGPDLAHAILANCGTLLGFRLGPQDAANIARWFGQEVTPEQLLRLPNRQFIARALRDGIPQTPVRITAGQE